MDWLVTWRPEDAEGLVAETRDALLDDRITGGGAGRAATAARLKFLLPDRGDDAAALQLRCVTGWTASEIAEICLSIGVASAKLAALADDLEAISDEAVGVETLRRDAFALIALADRWSPR